MNVKELKKFLNDKPEDAEVYFSVWMGGSRFGEHRYQCRMACPEKALSPSGKYLRLSWVDDCVNDRIIDQEFE